MEEAILEEAEARRDAIVEIARAIKARGRALQKLDEAERDVHSAILAAVAVGMRQAEIAERLGWPRQRVHAIVNADRLL